MSIFDTRRHCTTSTSISSKLKSLMVVPGAWLDVAVDAVVEVEVPQPLKCLPDDLLGQWHRDARDGKETLKTTIQ